MGELLEPCLHCGGVLLPLAVPGRSRCSSYNCPGADGPAQPWELTREQVALLAAAREDFLAWREKHSTAISLVCADARYGDVTITRIAHEFELDDTLRARQYAYEHRRLSGCKNHGPKRKKRPAVESAAQLAREADQGAYQQWEEDEKAHQAARARFQVMRAEPDDDASA